MDRPALRPGIAQGRGLNAREGDLNRALLADEDRTGLF